MLLSGTPSTQSDPQLKSHYGTPNRDRAHSLNRIDSDVFEPPNGALSPSFLLGETSMQSVDSGHLASNEATPEKKPSSSESLNTKMSPSYESIIPKTSSWGGVSTSREKVSNNVSRHSSLNLTDTPHTMYPCSNSSEYLNTLKTHLQDNIPEKGHLRQRDASLSSQKEPIPSTAIRVHKRSHNMSNNDVTIVQDGIILRPSPINLVGQSGLLSSLSAQGLINPKLECVGSFGCNVFMLFEAQVLEDDRGGSTTVTTKQLKFSKKLTERRAPFGR